MKPPLRGWTVVALSFFAFLAAYAGVFWLVFGWSPSGINYSGWLYPALMFFHDAIQEAASAPLALFVVLVLTATPPLFVGLLTLHLLSRRHRVSDSYLHCPKCGYILKGLSEPRCPECGERI